MDVEINYELSAGKNAEKKYQLRNKYSQKLKGVLSAIEITKKKIINQEKEEENKKNRISQSKKI
jgi:predicted ribosome quality control (RQC) complex YloA/Tae2 family protein